MVTIPRPTVDKLPPAPACDCCGSNSWQPAFTENSIDLGRCRSCGLYYVAQIPDQKHRVTEMEKGHYGDNQTHSKASIHLKDETIREKQFEKYVDFARKHAPVGKWLDIGCGTGTLIRLVQSKGAQIEGIELTPDRRELALKQTATTSIHSEPLEDLNLPSESFAVVSMINVFSHLISPTQTLCEINRVLIPGGILILVTGEIGEGAKKHHMLDWELGSHLYWLGEDTIRDYAQKTGFILIFRDKTWQPAQTYQPDRFRIPGRSRVRNTIKRACLTPGVFPLVRWYALKKNRGNPVYASTLVLRKSLR